MRTGVEQAAGSPHTATTRHDDRNTGVTTQRRHYGVSHGALGSHASVRLHGLRRDDD